MIGEIDLDCESLARWLQSEQAGEVQGDLEKRIVQFLFDYRSSEACFLQIIETLAWIGTRPNHIAFLEKEIIDLNRLEGTEAILCGSKFNELWNKTCKGPKFLADLKTDIEDVQLDFSSFSLHHESEHNSINVPQPRTSQIFKIDGKQESHFHIGWINGINNTFQESRENASYIQKLAGGHAVVGVYNCTHGPIIDVLEAAFLNHQGYSPNTSKLLQNEWQKFHKANIDRPNARLLQVCHSQGAINVKNALAEASLEIRNRVIVVAIAPAAVVPKRLCFESYNFASENDFVCKLEPPPSRPIQALTIDEVILPTFGEPMDDRNELIILKPHPEAKKIDHAFQSPTYQNELKNILEIYEQCKGEYLLIEKGK